MQRKQKFGAFNRNPLQTKINLNRNPRPGARDGGEGKPGKPPYPNLKFKGIKAFVAVDTNVISMLICAQSNCLQYTFSQSPHMGMS